MATNEFCVVREARPFDCEDILFMMKKLIHEEFGVTDDVKLDANMLRRDGFGTHKLFDCVVAEDTRSHGKLVGFAMHLLHYCTREGLYIYGQSIYVDPDYRIYGIGSGLMKEGAKLAIQNGRRTFVFNCYGWQKNNLALYERKGAVNCTKEEGANVFRLHEEQIRHVVDLPVAIEETIRIRNARAEDDNVILTLAKELASLKEQPNNVELDTGSFRQFGFGQEKLFNCVVAEERYFSGRVVGYALYSLHYSYFGIYIFVEDICVSPKHRQAGIEARLLQEVAKEAIQKRYMRLDFVGYESDKDVVAFLESVGATNRTRTEGTNRLCIRGKQLIKLSAAGSNL